jgi:hypothetical protein
MKYPERTQRGPRLQRDFRYTTTPTAGLPLRYSKSQWNRKSEIEKMRGYKKRMLGCWN